jgi:lauroyl/myristoyl acyltransferase
MSNYTFLRAWSYVLDTQAVAREAAGLPPATARERVQAVRNHVRLRAWRERQHIPKISELIGADHGHAALAGGPLIITFPHIGAFESAAQLLDEHYPERHPEVTVVGEDITSRHAPPRILNERYGWNPVSILNERCGEVAYTTLNQGGILAVSSDVLPENQDSTNVDFLDRWCALPSGPANLAIATGAVILPLATYMDGRRSKVLIRPPLWLNSSSTVESLTQEVTDNMSYLISLAPDQWFPPYPPKSAFSLAE